MEYSIGDFSTISRLGIKTLRYYHEIGLLSPSRVDPWTGYRYYDAACLVRVRAIQRLKALHFSLAEIQTLLADPADRAALQAALERKLAEVDQQIHEVQQVRERIAALLDPHAAPLALIGPALEKTLAAQRIASICFCGRYEDLSQKVPRLLAACGPALCGAPFSLYSDHTDAEDCVEIEICAPVNRTVEDPRGDPIHTRLLPGGRALTLLHSGPYEEISAAYLAMVEALHERGLPTRYPTREVYLQGADPGRSPAEYVTEIQVMIEG